MKLTQKRGEFTYAVKTKKIPEKAKPMKLILHVRKERWDCWNELAVYGIDKEILLISDRNYLRVPDPEEKYYFYFYTYTEDKPEYNWHYVKISKATSMKGFLHLQDDAKEYIKRWLEGEIYKIEHITEKGEELLDFLKLKKLELNGVKFFCEEEVFTEKKEIKKDDTHIILFKKAIIDKLNNDDAMYYIRPSKAMSVIVIKSKNPTYPTYQTQYYNGQIRYYPGCYDGYFIEIYKIRQADLPNTMLKQVKSKTEFSLISLVK